MANGKRRHGTGVAAGGPKREPDAGKEGLLGQEPQELGQGESWEGNVPWYRPELGSKATG